MDRQTAIGRLREVEAEMLSLAAIRDAYVGWLAAHGGEEMRVHVTITVENVDPAGDTPPAAPCGDGIADRDDEPRYDHDLRAVTHPNGSNRFVCRKCHRFIGANSAPCAVPSPCDAPVVDTRKPTTKTARFHDLQAAVCLIMADAAPKGLHVSSIINRVRDLGAMPEYNGVASRINAIGRALKACGAVRTQKGYWFLPFDWC